MAVNVDELYNSFCTSLESPPEGAKGREGEWTKYSQETVSTMALVAIAEQLKRIADVVEERGWR